VPGTPVPDHHLANLTLYLRPAPGDQYPLEQAELCFLAHLTDGRGVHEFKVRQRFGVGSQAQLVWESQPVTLDLGTDPLHVHGLPVRFRQLRFHHPGQYEFVLVCDGVELEPVAYVEARA
jgi:hypothetical protein